MKKVLERRLKGIKVREVKFGDKLIIVNELDFSEEDLRWVSFYGELDKKSIGNVLVYWADWGNQILYDKKLKKSYKGHPIDWPS
ncbi:hypothetical protein HY498_04450 [Candidatus Woesearchaeota archaeon]|nr:hypothetical protein [Candidatus Woesearchaeota archaeon]